MSQRANIKLYFSNAVEQLAAQLTTNLSAETTSINNPLEPQKVIVPNANMQRYLQLYIADTQGVCANIEFPFLEKGLTDYLCGFQQPSQQTEVLSQNALVNKIFTLLSTPELIDSPALKLMKQYLSGNDPIELLSQKKWQLSQRLAILLINYELQRPEMVLLWLQGKSQFNFSQDSYLRSIEQLQKALYLRLYQDQSSDLTLFQRFQQIDWQQAQWQPQALHLFTPSRLSAFHRQLLCQLGRYLDVHIYQLNVCCEYWEDLRTTREDAWMASVQAAPVVMKNAVGESITTDAAVKSAAEVFFEMDDSNIENPLLKAWAKPGREALRLFSQLEDDALHLAVHYSNDWLESKVSRNDGILHVIQDTVLYRERGQALIKTAAQLQSLQLAQAPSIQREVEAVYNNILWNLQQDDALMLTDVAVLVTDMEKYRFVIEQVFAEKNQQNQITIAFSLIDSTVKTESLFAQAVMGLLAILEDDLMRSGVFKWLSNVCVKQALELNDDIIADWLDWAAQLGVFSGFDQLYQSEDDQLASRFTWQQGLQRIRQSLVAQTADHITGDVDRIGHLAWVIESLHDWQHILQKQQSASQWWQTLNHLFDTYIAIPETHDKELLVRQAINDSFSALVTHTDGIELNYHEIKCYVEQELTQLSASKGNYLSGGVVCAALQPMRPIPFKVTYILGLEEKAFPGYMFRETLDLTQRSRQIGDINKVENMNYLFLETLICTRHKLYLSYVGQDLVKDETILPSPVILELKAYAETLMDHEALGMSAYPVATIPLDAADKTAFVTPVAESDWLVNYTAIDYYKYLLRHNRKQAIQFIKTHQAGHSQRDPSQPFMASATQQTAATVAVKTNDKHSYHINALSKFLENPALSFVSVVGASSQLLDDQINVSHEPFVMDGLARHGLFEQAVQAYLSTHLHQDSELTLMHCLQQSYAQLAAQSKLPIELFAELNQFEDLADHRSFAALVTELSDLTALSGPVVFGEGMHQRAAHQQAEPMVIDVAGEPYTLNGSWEGLYETAGYISHQVVVTSGAVTGKWHKSIIKPFLYWCMAQLDPTVKVAESFQLRLVGRKQVHSFEFKRWSFDNIHFSTDSQLKEYLTGLLKEFLMVELVNLPFELMNGFKVLRDDREVVIPYIKPNSKAKEVQVFAYQPSSLSQGEISQIQNIYLHHANKWLLNHNYHELLLAMPLKTANQALAVYRRRLLPLHVMAQLS